MDKSLVKESKVNRFVKENKVSTYLVVGIVVYIIAFLSTMVITSKNESKEEVNIYNNTDLKTLEIIAGITKVKGEGIEIRLEDGGIDDINQSSRTDTIVHDSDLLSIINELKAAGAEAISVNDERIVNTTSVRCVGPVIQINYNKVASPFVIKAIGNSKLLYSALNIQNGIVDILKNAKIKVNIEMKKNIEINEYSGDYTFKYIE